MRTASSLHLTYCLNVHPGETWQEQFAAIRNHAEPVARAVAGDRPFGLGLRLSARSAAQLAAAPAELAEVRRYLDAHGLYALTVNAFPYGVFHGTAVKDAVYRPDWADPARIAYTRDAAEALAALLPDGVPGSLSTAPLTFKGWPDWQRAVPAAREAFAEAGRTLARLEAQTGRRIVMALEPEPFCYPENTDELLELFAALPDDVRIAGTLGACFDTAHHAVAFEDLPDSLDRLARAGIPVGKIQLSAAIAADTGAAAREQLRTFADPVYLHQTRTHLPGGGFRATPDLAPALAEETLWASGGEVRVHYHVPLFVERFGALRSTADLLRDPRFVERLRAGRSATLEIETYTWSVWRATTGESAALEEGIARELAWTQRLLGAPDVPRPGPGAQSHAGSNGRA